MNDNRMGGIPPPPQGVKRRMPGDGGNGPPPQRPFDPRFGGSGRGGGRGFTGRPNIPGMGRGPPPPPPMRGRGFPFRGRGSQPHFRGRGFLGRGPPMMGRGPPPPPPLPLSAGVPMGSRGPPPPPPPRGRGPSHPPGGIMMPPMVPPPINMPFSHNQPRQMNVPPPPMNAIPHVLRPPQTPISPNPQQPPRPPLQSQLQQQRGFAPNRPLQPPLVNHILTPNPKPAMVAPPASPIVPQTQTKPNNGVPQPASYTKEQIDKAWTEHLAPNSTKYYYNAITKESTYKLPECMENSKPSDDGTTTPAWTEYTDLRTGKKYYSNGATTTWEKPDNFDNSQTRQSTPEEDALPRKKKKTTPKKETEFGSKTEAIAAFKGLLLAKGVLPTTKWNEVVKMCSSDSRWEACEVLTLGERKQALAEYQTKRANELRNMERQERMRAKDAFGELLTEVLPSTAGFNPLISKFTDVRDSLSKDDRFYAVEDEETRDTLFLEFCEEVRKRDERKKRTRKREAKESFLSFLKEHEEDGDLSFASTWSSFYASLNETEGVNDNRFQVSLHMSDSDRELYFSDYVIELQVAEDEKRRRIRDARRRAEKAQREVFRDDLRKLASKGSITPASRWRNIEDEVSGLSSYGPVKEQERNAPRELFEDFVEEWNDLYRRDRSLLSRLVRPSSNQVIVVATDTSYEAFCKALLDEAAYSAEYYSDARQIINHDDPVSSARIYFNELVARARESAETTPKRFSHRRSQESSEDEGEIIEDEEENEKRSESKTGGDPRDPRPTQKDDAEPSQTATDKVGIKTED